MGWWKVHQESRRVVVFPGSFFRPPLRPPPHSHPLCGSSHLLVSCRSAFPALTPLGLQTLTSQSFPEHLLGVPQALQRNIPQAELIVSWANVCLRLVISVGAISAAQGGNLGVGHLWLLHLLHQASQPLNIVNYIKPVFYFCPLISTPPVNTSVP